MYVVLKEFALAIDKGMGEGGAGLVLVQVHSKEEAFALWIGCGQQSGKFMHKQDEVAPSGWLFGYSL